MTASRTSIRTHLRIRPTCRAAFLVVFALCVGVGTIRVDGGARSAVAGSVVSQTICPPVRPVLRTVRQLPRPFNATASCQLAPLAPVPLSTPPPGGIALFAGRAIKGGGTGLGTGVGPWAVALAKPGLLLVSDVFYSVVWLMNTTATSATLYGQTIAPGRLAIIAGNDTFGYGGDSGPATSAALNGPSGLAVDQSGNLFISDTGNNRIREVIVATGVITTVVGTGSPGCVPYGNTGNALPCYGGDGGQATSAALNNPIGLAFDTHGDLYVSDTGNHSIRMITPAQVITTVAGTGQAGSGGDGKAATQAQLSFPLGLAVDTAGDVFIADSGNSRVREIVAATGMMAPVAGGGSGCAAQVDQFGDGCAATQAKALLVDWVALDSGGTLYLTDSGNNIVRRVDAATHMITRIAGSPTGQAGFTGDKGSALMALLDTPTGIAVDAAGTLFLVDANNRRVRQIAGGTITSIIGTGRGSSSGDGKAALQAVFSGPAALAFSHDGTRLYVADAFANRVRMIDLASGIISTVAGTGVAGAGGDGKQASKAQLNYPSGIALDSADNLYIADSKNDRIREVLGGTSTGVITTVVGAGTICPQATDTYGDGCPAGQSLLSLLYYAGGSVAVDGADNLFIGDPGHKLVREVSATTKKITALAVVSVPISIAADRFGHVFVGSVDDYVREIDVATGVVTPVAGNGSAGCPVDGGGNGPCFGGDNGLATLATLNQPSGIVVDGVGNVFIADSGNNRVREVVASTKKIMPLAGTGMPGYSGDNGPSLAAKLSFPSGLALDPAGNLYIGDAYNNRVRVVGG